MKYRLHFLFSQERLENALIFFCHSKSEVALLYAMSIRQMLAFFFWC